MPFTLNRGKMRVAGGGNVSASAPITRAGAAVVSGDGVVSASVSTDQANGAEADWLFRISQPGVVWYHDFRGLREVDAFRNTTGIGNDPDDIGPLAGTCIRQTADGVTGGACLEITRPAGTAEPPGWWRPFSPMSAASTGKPADDPGANGSIPLEPWDYNDPNQITNFTKGWYGHPDYWDGNFDGHVFYLQVRVKSDPRRITGGNEAFTAGKFCWFTTAERRQSLSRGEHVFWSYGNGGNDGFKNYLRCYVYDTTGIGPFDPLDQAPPVSSSDGIQPGSGWSTDWAYSNGWDTLLFQIKLGKKTVMSGEDCSRLRVYAANEGETEYTKVWDQEYGIDTYQADEIGINGTRNGLQAFLASAYNNGQNLPQDFWQRFDQFIFSHDFIPCPNSTAASLPPWYTGLNHLEAAAPATNWLGSTGVQPAVNPGFRFEGIVDAWTGMGVDTETGEVFLLANGGHNDYYGNEVYSVGMKEDAPAWQRRRDPTYTGNYEGPVLPDGRPASMHTAGYHVFAEGRWMLLGSCAYTEQGSSALNYWWEYRPQRGKEDLLKVGTPGTEDWVSLGTNHNSAAGPPGFQGAVYDPIDRQIIIISGDGNTPHMIFQSIDDIENPTPTLQNNNAIGTSRQANGAVDTTNHNLIMHMEAPFPFRLGWLNLDSDATKQQPYQYFNPTGTPPTTPNSTTNGLYWHKPSQAFITWDGGDQLYKLTPTVDGNGDYTGAVWSTVPLDPGGVTMPSTSADTFQNGIYDKVNFIEDMGDGTSALICLANYSFPDIHVIRITGAL